MLEHLWTSSHLEKNNLKDKFFWLVMQWLFWTFSFHFISRRGNLFVVRSSLFYSDFLVVSGLDCKVFFYYFYLSFTNQSCWIASLWDQFRGPIVLLINCWSLNNLSYSAIWCPGAWCFLTPCSFSCYYVTFYMVLLFFK